MNFGSTSILVLGVVCCLEFGIDFGSFLKLPKSEKGITWAGKLKLKHLPAQDVTRWLFLQIVRTGDLIDELIHVSFLVVTRPLEIIINQIYFQ